MEESKGCVRLYTDNYADLDLLANYTVGSEKTAFPIENAFNLQRRSKVYRSNGYYNVTSANNVIIFNEGGLDLTATIAIAEYNSTTSFMTAVKTALDSAGLATYTVTQTANFKFQIASNLGGGATAFELITTDNDFTALDLLGLDNSADKTAASSYIADAIRICTEEFLIIDMGIDSKPNAFALTDARNQPLKLSPNASVVLMGNYTNNFTSPAYSLTLSYDDEVLSAISDLQLGNDGYRYWKIQFNDKENPQGFIQVGAIFLGRYFAPSMGRVNFPLNSQYIDRSTVIFSEGGQTFADIFEQSQEYQIQWRLLNKEDMQEITEIFRRYGTSQPFFVLFDREAGFSTKMNRSLKFVKFSDEPSYSLERPNKFECNMRLREEL